MPSNQVKIYETTCYQGFMMEEQGTRFTLHPWIGNNIDYKGYSDDGYMYNLPNECNLGNLSSGEKAIFDGNDKYCELINKDGVPAIVLKNDIVKLEKVGA